MRAVLVASPTPAVIMPVGVLSLAGAGKQCGVDAEVVKFPMREEEPLFFKHLFDADVIGFSATCSNYPRLLLLAKRLKELGSKAVIVVGGPQATCTAKQTVARFPFVDLIIRGEAEESWRLFLEQIKSGNRDWSKVPCSVWREGDAVKETLGASLIEDLDKLPIPAYEKFSLPPGIKSISIEVGRGCPFRCTFCSTNDFFGRKFRMKSPARIIEEMHILNKLYDVEYFEFIHDSFTANIKELRKVCDLLKDVPYKWSCSCRSDTVNKETLKMMYDSGCRGVYYGIETGSQRMQKTIKKNLNIQDSVRAIRDAKKIGFNVSGSLIVGFPQETREDLFDSLLLATEMMAGLTDMLQFPVFSPMPDTPLTKEGWKFDFDGVPSNVIEIEGNPNQAESMLIQDDFDIFSAFYHSSGTEYSRSDYLVLSVVIEKLHKYPSVKKFVLKRDRIAFVKFLVKGLFGSVAYSMSMEDVLENTLNLYGDQSRHRVAILNLIGFDKICNHVKSSPVGNWAVYNLIREHADIALGKNAPQCLAHEEDYMEVNITHGSSGLECKENSARVFEEPVPSCT